MNELSPHNFHRYGLNPGLAKAEAWLAPRARQTIFLIILISALFRIGLFLELNGTPFMKFHLIETTDMNFAHQLAKNIVAGDLLIDKPFYLFVDINIDIARVYFQMNPDELNRIKKQINASGDMIPPEKALWNEWFHGKTFYQEPLYSYLIALTYWLFGEDPRYVYIWQMILGTLTNVLIFLIARIYFGELAALFAALLAVFCGPLMFSDLVLLRTTAGVFAAVALVYAASLVFRRTEFAPWFGLGAVIGLAMTLHSYFVLFLVGVTAVLAAKRFSREAAKHIFGLAVGAVFALSPVIARNIAVDVHPLAIAANGANTFIHGNTPDYNPWMGFIIRDRSIAKIMGETGGKLFPVIIATLKTHDSALSYIALLMEKFRAFLNWREIPNNVNFYYFKLHSNALTAMPVTFFILGPLSILGIAISIRKKIPCAPLYIMALILLAILIGFMPLGRYRTVLVAVAIPFAGYAAVMAFRGARAFAMSTAAVALILTASWASSPSMPLLTIYDYSLPAVLHYHPIIAEAKKEGDWEKVAEIYGEWIAFEREFGASGDSIYKTSPEILRPAANTFRKYAAALRRTGKNKEARIFERKAERIVETLRRRYPGG